MIRKSFAVRPFSSRALRVAAKCLAVGALLVAIPLIAAKTQTITVKKGDTLWSLAKQYLGSPYKWKDLHGWNKDTVKNANQIIPGQVLIIPGDEPETPTTVAEPTKVEIPVSVVEQMLRDLSARTEAMAKDLAAARDRLEALEAKAGMMSEHLTAKGTGSMDTAMIIKRLDALEKALSGVMTRDDLMAMADKHGQMFEKSQADTTAELKMLRAELGVIQKSVESQVDMQSKAITELNAKLAQAKPMEMNKDEETPKKRGLVGLLSTLAVGIGFLAVSASN
jgi:LysM repeat protein